MSNEEKKKPDCIFTVEISVDDDGDYNIKSNIVGGDPNIMATFMATLARGADHVRHIGVGYDDDEILN